MPVEAKCGGCAKTIRVGDQYAGKTIKCPACKHPIRLPAAPPPPKAAPPPPKRVGPSAPAPAPPRDAWHVHSHDGTHYGPITKAELDQWVAEGLVGPTCQVRQGESVWRAASEVYPQLAGGRAMLDPDYQPLLRATGKSNTLASMSVSQELPKSGRGNSITYSEVYQVGQARTFWDKLKANTHVGPFVKTSEIHVDQIHLMTIADPEGEFHIVAPLDNGKLVPVEFFCLLPGRLPTSLGLLRGEGRNTGIDVSNSAAGVFLPQIARMAMSYAGGQASAEWAVLDEDEPPAAAEVAAGFPQLRADLRFDAKLLMGQMEITYRIGWIAQALPLGDQQYLLVAKFIPQNSFFTLLDLGAAWFTQWRSQFLQMAQHLPTAGNARRCCYDHGNWAAVAYEVFGLDVF